MKIELYTTREGKQFTLKLQVPMYLDMKVRELDELFDEFANKVALKDKEAKDAVS